MRIFLWTALLLALAASPLFAQENAGSKIGQVKTVPDEAAQSVLAKVESWRKQLQQKKATLDVQKAPLSDALQVISEQIEIPIRIDQRAFDEVGLTIDAQVTLQANNISAQSLLKHLLRQWDLTYRIDATGVVITTYDVAESQLERRIYPIGDLIRRDALSYPEYLKGVVTSAVDSSQWEHLGGPATIKHFRDNLIIDCTGQTHNKIESLLARLREAKSLSSDEYPTAALSVFPPGNQAADVEARLNSVRLPVQLIDVPLQEAIDLLADTSDIRMILDTRSLSEIGIRPEEPITLQAEDLSVMQTLAILGERYEFTWYTIGGVIVVTTEQVVETELEIRVYPVRDIAWHGLDIRDPEFRLQLLRATQWEPEDLFQVVGRTRLNSTDLPEIPAFNALIDTIASSVRPGKWESQGGPGAITDYPLCDCLVVKQTREMHDQVAELLAQIRTQSDSSNQENLAQRIEQVGNEVLTARYTPYQVRGDDSDFTREDFQAIGRQVEQLFEPDSWQTDEHFVLATQAGLIVRHQRAMHEKIKTFLDEIGLGLPIRTMPPPSTSSYSNDSPRPKPAATGSSIQDLPAKQEGGVF